MVIRTVRAVAWTLVAAAAVFTLSGCNNASLRIKVANEGVYPITEVILYPAVAEGEAPGPEAQINRMPTDSEDHTVALLANDATMLDWRFRTEVYQVSVTFYDSKNQIFRQVQPPGTLDLTAVKRNSLVILTAAMDANNAGTVKYEIIEEDADLFSWPGWGWVLTAAGTLALVLLWPFSGDL